MRKIILAFSASVLALSVISCEQKNTNKQEEVKKISLDEIHDEALIIDSHIDIDLDFLADDLDPWSSGKTSADMDKLEKGQMDGAFLIVYSGQDRLDEQGFAKARKIAETRYKAIKRLAEKYKDRLEIATNVAQAKALHNQGKRIAFIGMENAYPLGNSVKDVRFWADRGVRYVGITHMGHNQFGDSSNPKYNLGDKESLHGGLSDLGRELVKELNKNGIMVDISHAAKSTSLQAIELSEVPVIASHSGVMGVAKNARNLDDETIKALAEKGGVVQIVAFGAYLKELTAEQKQMQEKIRAELGLQDDLAFISMDEKTKKIYDDKMKSVMSMSKPASIADLVDHIDYVAMLVGVDYVGISSDFDGGGKIEGWLDASQTKNVTKELLDRGYSEEDIKKIWGGNLLRVLQSAQDFAKSGRSD